jgi:hypothetical protein
MIKKICFWVVNEADVQKIEKKREKMPILLLSKALMNLALDIQEGKWGKKEIGRLRKIN